MDFTLECSGNHGFPVITGLIGNARWGGTPLAPVLRKQVFSRRPPSRVLWDRSGTQTIRDNTGIVSGGLTGMVETDSGGSLDLTVTEHFARSMSLDEALDPRNLLCYEMNGEPLPEKNGFPIRLIAPGWYGVANVKWLTRIEVRDQRHAGNFMARDYVTIREEQRNGEPFWTFSTVRHDRLKSAPAKVVRRSNHYVVLGAAWGAPIAAVQVRIDNGPWMAAKALRAGGPQPQRSRLGVDILDVPLGNACRGRAHGHVTRNRHRGQRAAGAGRSLPRQQTDLLGEQRTHHTPGAHSLIANSVTIGRADAAGRRLSGGIGCARRARNPLKLYDGNPPAVPNRLQFICWQATRVGRQWRCRWGDASFAGFSPVAATGSSIFMSASESVGAFRMNATSFHVSSGECSSFQAGIPVHRMPF